jgi:hypothetical protein
MINLHAVPLLTCYPKCDIVRPCTLCIWSCVACVATRDPSQPYVVSLPRPNGRRKKRKLDDEQDQTSTGTPSATRTTIEVVEEEATAPVLSPAESFDGELVRTDQIHSQHHDAEGISASHDTLPSTSKSHLHEKDDSSQDAFGGDSSTIGLTMKVSGPRESSVYSALS